MKNNNQPQHTQGEWKINQMGNIDCGEMRICNMPSITGKEEEIKANAQLILRAVNMHDELIAAVKDCYLEVIHKAESNLTPELCCKLDQLLKQAEGK